MKRQLLHKHHTLGKERKTRVKFVSLKASYPLIRRTRAPNLRRWIIYTETQRIVAEYKKLQIQTIQTKNKTVFIPDKAHKQNLPPYQHNVCAPIWNISHIVSSLLRCGLQRNDRYSTNNQRLVPHLLQPNRQRKEQQGQCPDVIKCQTELDPSRPFSSISLKDLEEHSTQADWFWI